MKKTAFITLFCLLSIACLTSCHDERKRNIAFSIVNNCIWTNFPISTSDTVLLINDKETLDYYTSCGECSNQIDFETQSLIIIGGGCHGGIDTIIPTISLCDHVLSINLCVVNDLTTIGASSYRLGLIVDKMNFIPQFLVYKTYLNNTYNEY